MAKDPAFLFYSQDFLVGTMTMNFEDRGKFITILSLMHQQGRMTEETISLLVGSVSVNLKSKFKLDDKGFLYNERLEIEIEKRNKFTKSRRDNGLLGGRPSNNDKPKNNLSGNHMGNEDEDVNNNKKEVEDFIKFRNTEYQDLRDDLKTKLQKYHINEPVIIIGKKIPVQYFDLAQFVLDTIDDKEWSKNMQIRFGNKKYDRALQAFIIEIKTTKGYQDYNGVNDFQRHFTHWLKKHESKY